MVFSLAASFQVVAIVTTLALTSGGRSILVDGVVTGTLVMICLLLVVVAVRLNRPGRTPRGTWLALYVAGFSVMMVLMDVLP